MNSGEEFGVSETTTEIAMFDRIGGALAIDRLVEAFYGYMDSFPQAKKIRDMHDVDLGPVKKVLKRYLSEWTGGPKLYSPEKGHPRLRQRHMGFPIGNAERDAWLLCMRQALGETIADPAARAELDANMTKLADWMRNQADNPHDRGEGRP
ncbi:group II truncated hemoglobin [Rhodoblastus sp.]|uniref:group II truncated hemoglobin n=1 Tax=Rhodoblastus sp. TaxID=1962975 RepID=UPI003F99AE93